MMTVGAASIQFNRGKSEPELKPRHKRVTPFSINDILAHKSTKASPDCETLGKTDFSSFEIAKQHFDMNHFCEKNLAWSFHAYAYWHSLGSFQPFWLSHLLQEPVQPSLCCRVSNENFWRSSDERPRSENTSEVSNTNSDFCSKNYVRKRRISDTESVLIENQTKNANSLKFDIKWNNVKEHGFCSSGTVTDSEYGQHSDESYHTPNADSKSPLSALEQLTCSTFKNMEEKKHELHTIASDGENVKAKRRKCRTAFTSFQLSVLEERFKCHKYLTPSGRDQIAAFLGLTAPQVITWFQNRRAKQKRDLEEMKNDFKTVEKTMNNSTSQILSTSLLETRASDGLLRQDPI